MDMAPDRPGGRAEADVLGKGAIYYGKDKGSVSVTMPLRDRNGDAIAAVRVVMKSFPGQTENNALARALPIAKDLERNLTGTRELF